MMISQSFLLATAALAALVGSSNAQALTNFTNTTLVVDMVVYNLEATLRHNLPVLSESALLVKA